ncbi:hypothetical protein Y1Q_0007495 [Alligator mississippiensis]|uniref:Uncharacterized protein n=1 Tax=Alligator mississippiensis TaxID=8496 RepID=A0A151M4W8_ALLMI|nr:hypothetical protein Y1Q_0007495 [Alligator mississippiensis]
MAVLSSLPVPPRAMASPASALSSNNQDPGLLLDTTLDLLACRTNCQLAYGHLGPPGSPMCSDDMPSHCTPSQSYCCHAAAAWTLVGWLGPGKDANNMLLDATTGATLALLGLQPHCLWASHDWWLHVI